MKTSIGESRTLADQVSDLSICKRGINNESVIHEIRPSRFGKENQMQISENCLDFSLPDDEGSFLKRCPSRYKKIDIISVYVKYLFRNNLDQAV